MKKEKQLKILELILSGRYQVINDNVYSKGKKLKGNKFISGYTQLLLCGISVYKHIVVYLANFGEYPEGYEIDHSDRNNANDLPGNLIAKTKRQNIANSISSRCRGAKIKTIRNKEIKAIRLLLKLGESQSSIAKHLKLNRLSVRYIIKNIEAGNKLKYELPDRKLPNSTNLVQSKHITINHNTGYLSR